ncbi:MAG: hypothetical protein ACPGWS_02975, partial [Solirubrobacterales bacterium]
QALDRLGRGHEEQVRAQGSSKTKRTDDDFRREAQKQAAYTLLNRLVIVRLMEAPGPRGEPLRKPAIAPTLDLTTHFRAVLPPEGLPDQPLLVHNTSIAVEDGLADSDSRVFSANGRLLAQGRQLQMLAPFGES